MAEYIHQIPVRKDITGSGSYGQIQPGSSRFSSLEHPALRPGPNQMKDFSVIGLDRISRPGLIAGHIQNQVQCVIGHESRVFGQNFLGIDVGPGRNVHGDDRPRGLHAAVHQCELLRHRPLDGPVIPGLTGNLAMSGRHSRHNQFPFAISRNLELVGPFSRLDYHYLRIGDLQVEPVADGRLGIGHNGEKALLSVLPLLGIVADLQGDAFQLAGIRHHQFLRIARSQG